MPRAFLIDRIERIASVCLDLEDSWEYRRLLELYAILDSKLASRLAEAGVGDKDSDIREAAIDYLKDSAGFNNVVGQGLEDPLP